MKKPVPPKPMAMPATSFTGANGFDLMGGHQPKPDIVGRPANATKPPLVPGTGMGLGLSGKP